MENKNELPNKGLTDDHNGDLILNESGTSINIGHLKDEDTLGDKPGAIEETSELPIEEFDEGKAQVRYDISDRQ